MRTALEIAAIVFIIAWNAFFVAAEYAFVSVRRTRLVELIEQGSAKARRALEIVDDPAQFISAVQVAITMSSLALGAVGEAVFSDLFRRALSPFGLDSDASVRVASLALGFVVATSLHVVLGEIVPKTFTLARAEAVALRAAAPCRGFMRLFRPFIWALRGLAEATTRVLGLPSPREMRLAHSEEELKMLVSASREEGVLEAEEQEMLYKVFDFSETQAEEVMVPRPDVVALPVALAPRAAMEEVARHPYTRYPVYGEDIDDIVGVLHVRRLYEGLQNGGASATDLRTLIRPAHYVPETKRLGKLLEELRRTKTHFAIVVDEYGSTAGILTLEDLLEEIVGEIADEFDRPDVSILRLNKTRVRVAGSFPIGEFNERFGHRLSDDDYTTLGGWVFGELGRAPEAGDAVDVGDIRVIVHETDGPRIRALDIDLSGQDAAPAPTDADGADPAR